MFVYVRHETWDDWLKAFFRRKFRRGSRVVGNRDIEDLPEDISQ
jgi:hypothetical protein